MTNAVNHGNSTRERTQKGYEDMTEESVVPSVSARLLTEIEAAGGDLAARPVAASIGSSSLKVFATADDAGHAIAMRIAAGIRAAGEQGRRYVLGCPGGRSPQPIYSALARIVAEQHMRLDHVVIAMMDDYARVSPDGGYEHVDPDAHYSCIRFGREEILVVLNAGAQTPIPADSLWLPDPRDTDEYEARLADAGGVDVFLLASGATDGHVAFNPVGTAEDASTRIVRLTVETKTDNLGTFPEFASLADVPEFGVTVGPRTILDNARERILIVTGSHKQEAFRRLAVATGYDPSWPATVVAAADATSRAGAVYADAAAAGVAS